MAELNIPEDQERMKKELETQIRQKHEDILKEELAKIRKENEEKSKLIKSEDTSEKSSEKKNKKE